MYSKTYIADCSEPIVFKESYQAVIILPFQLSPQRAALEAYHKGWGVSTIIGVTAAGQGELSVSRYMQLAKLSNQPPTK